MVRLFVPLPEPAPPEVTLSGERRHYLVHVLRLAEGSSLEVFDGAGRAFEARVASLDTEAVRLVLGEARHTPPPRPLHILQGLPKGDKLEWVLQKGTELGATAFHPVATARSVVKLEPRRAEERTTRWSKIVEEAARQCRRNDVPVVHVPCPLVDAVRSLAPGTTLLVLDEEESAVPLGEAFRSCAPGAPVALVVGPEGGLAREEVSALRQLGARPVTLGRRILRTETAALAALAVMGFLDGELG
ncbi:16S rRNA (uracil1498-N3)-methyltransferase [Archangium gephyra]|uniref:Ribosomal RNA small subunit methyltransferase E n=1 Tax=Archangium gephyra TaxID=48 RepID=A0AAC8Q4D3_9BACT|nr:16S rRNA (uracil(1498)-N(3))-methyltransferase [Archangium gephyra]AKJ00734.1 Ribosomal RNA small subunit methyltransferase E [Archangium gephyra]REG20776.1 16S rRNA (uracil1498-N3)-methyltransferase [Archangium gephyra]